LMEIQLCIASPRCRHTSSWNVSSVVNKTKKFFFAHRLTQFSQYVIVYVSSLTASNEEQFCVGKTAYKIIPWKQIGTNRQKNAKSVTIRLHFWLTCQPVEDAECNLKRFFAIFFMFRKSACLEVVKKNTGKSRLPGLQFFQNNYLHCKLH
jgi:hypothetical protein